MLQLNWVAESWSLDKDAMPHKLLGTALEALQVGSMNAFSLKPLS